MTKSFLGIGIASNRKLAGSAAAVKSAADFCANTDCRLVVSDNSGDPEKEAALARQLPGGPLRYIKTPACGMIENFAAAFNATDAEFVMMMGDDDSLFRFGQPADFKGTPDHVVCIKPWVFGYTDKLGIMRINNKPVQAATAAERIVENLNLANGSNIGYFAFWRRSVFAPLMNLWFQHPTKGSYCDWALMNALVSCGKVVLDTSTCYFYNLQNWAGDAAAIAAQLERAYIGAGLPPGSSAYGAILNAIDSYIFINSRHSPLEPRERGLTALFCLNIYLKGYIANIPERSGHENEKEIAVLSRRLVGNDSVPSIFALLSDIAGAIKPGFDKEYRAFHTYAVGRPWGDF